MNAQTKKCPMCAEQIALEATACEYCGAQFEVTIIGYCANCHQVRNADKHGCCIVCSGEIIDLRVESRLIEEPSVQISKPVEEHAPSSPTTQKTWVLVLGAVMVLGVVALAFSLGSKLAPIVSPSTSTPTLTPTLVPSPDVTSTIMPRPTLTNTPIPAWVRDFAEPILAALKDRPPDFQDDFSHAQGWQFSTGPDSKSGDLEFMDGSLQMSVTSKTTTAEVGFAAHPKLRSESFVLQVDGYLSQLKQPDTLEISWRGGSDGAGVVFSLWRDGRWQVAFCGSCSPALADGRTAINWAEPVGITIISKDAQYAIYVNRTPLGYVNDAGRRPSSEIQLILWVATGGHTSSVRYDDLKVWDISNISIP